MTEIERVPYARHISRAIRRARLERDLEQSQLGRRMKALGYPWHPQTVSTVENAKRRVPAEELVGLALALETPISTFLAPYGGLRPTPAVQMDDGHVVPGSIVAAAVGTGRFDQWVFWADDDTPIWPDEETTHRRVSLDAELDVAMRAMERARDEWMVAATNAKQAELDGGVAQATAQKREQEARAAADDASEVFHILTTELGEVRDNLRRSANSKPSDSQAEEA